jgi:hypothetical protein
MPPGRFVNLIEARRSMVRSPYLDFVTYVKQDPFAPKDWFHLFGFHYIVREQVFRSRNSSLETGYRISLSRSRRSDFCSGPFLVAVRSS